MCVCVCVCAYKSYSVLVEPQHIQRFPTETSWWSPSISSLGFGFRVFLLLHGLPEEC